MNLTVLERIGGLYYSKVLGFDISESKKIVLQEIASHINKLKKDIKTNDRLSTIDKGHIGSLAENIFLLDEYTRYHQIVSEL